MENYESFKEVCWTIAVSAYGAVANILSGAKPPKGKALVNATLKSIIVSGFCGIIAFLLAKYLKLGIYEQYLLAGIAGYMGGRFLQQVEKRVTDMLPTRTDKGEK